MNTLLQAIRDHPFTHGVLQSYVETLAAGATIELYEADRVLLRQGETANKFYLIISGRVAIEAHEPGDGSILIQEVGSGEALGWSWFVPPYAWHFQVRTLEPTRAIVLSGAHLLIYAEEQNKEFGYELMKRIAQMVVLRLQSTRRQLLKQAKTHPPAP